MKSKILIIILIIIAVSIFVAKDILKIKYWTYKNEIVNNVDIDINKSNIKLHLYFIDGYIHYNKLNRTKDEFIEIVKNLSKDNKKTQIIIENPYTNTWDKYLYDETLNIEYEFKDISTNILDIEKDGNILNIQLKEDSNDIDWNMAEFIFNQFYKDITDDNSIATINIISNDNNDVIKYTYIKNSDKWERFDSFMKDIIK